MKKVVGIGACVLDTLIECDFYPKEDVKYRAKKTVKVGGGPVANALVVMAKFGVDTHFLGNLSKNNDGDFLVSELNRYNVSTRAVNQIQDTRAFTSYVVLSKRTGSRTCIFERGNVPDDPTILDFSIIDNADVLHLDGNNLTTAIEACKYAKEKGITISLDAGSLYENIELLLPYVDILIPSEEFTMGITRTDNVKDAIKLLQKKYNPKILVVTEGSKGGVYYDNGQIKSYDSIKIECVDSNGAGDTFHGAFIAAYLKGFNVEESCKFASIVAGLKCTKVGMRDAIPSFDDVMGIYEKS